MEASPGEEEEEQEFCFRSRMNGEKREKREKNKNIADDMVNRYTKATGEV